MDVHFHRVAFDFLTPAIESLFDLGARQNVSGALEQELHESKLPGRQSDVATITGNPVRGRIQHHAEMLDLRGGSARFAAQERPDPRGQLIEVEGLDQIVVGSRVESLHPVGDCVPGRDDEYRQSGMTRPQALQHVQPVPPGQPQVEQEQIELLGAQHLLGGIALVHPIDREAIAPQTGTNRLADHRVIFNEQQSHDRPYPTGFLRVSRRHSLSSIAQRLVHGAAGLGVVLAERDATRLLQLLDEVARWNRTYNLTAIRGREDMLTHHLLDSLSLQPDLHGSRLADLGTGAGFPGLPLALANPDRRFTLIDSNGKKVRFVRHAARELGLDNVEVLHSRVERVTVAQPFDSVLARAFASLPDLLRTAAPLCAPDGRVLAMKGKWPQAEIDALPPGWRSEGSHTVTVPGLAESRCVIILERSR